MQHARHLDDLERGAPGHHLELGLRSLGEQGEGVLPLREIRSAIARQVKPCDRHLWVRGHVVVEDRLNSASGVTRAGQDRETERRSGREVDAVDQLSRRTLEIRRDLAGLLAPALGLRGDLKPPPGGLGRELGLGDLVAVGLAGAVVLGLDGDNGDDAEWQRGAEGDVGAVVEYFFRGSQKRLGNHRHQLLRPGAQDRRPPVRRRGERRREPAKRQNVLILLERADGLPLDLRQGDEAHRLDGRTDIKSLDGEAAAPRGGGWTAGEADRLIAGRYAPKRDAKEILVRRHVEQEDGRGPPKAFGQLPVDGAARGLVQLVGLADSVGAKLLFACLRLSQLSQRALAET